MAFMRYFVVSLCVVLLLVSCVGSDTSKLQLTIDAQYTRLATMESATQEPGAVPTNVGTPTVAISPAGSNTATPEGGQTEATESAESARLTGMLLPGETWQKGETEITLSNPKFTPGCGGLFGFQLEVADRSGGILNGEDIAIYDESDSLFSEVWWKSGSPSGQCYDSQLDALSWNSAGRPTVIISFRVLGDPDRGVSRVEVTPPDPGLGTAVWDISALAAQNLPTETPSTEENTGTISEPTLTPEEPVTRRPVLLWTSAAESFAVSDGIAFVELPDGRVQARELESGDIAWESQIRCERILAADSDNVYVIPSSQRIDALNAATGEESWTALLPEVVYRSSYEYAQTASDLFVYLEDSDSQSMYGIKIARIDKNSGLVELLPLRRSAGRLNIVADGVLVIDREIGWSPSTRRVLWNVSDIAWEKSLCSGLLIFSSRDGLNALEVASGDIRWTVELPASEILCKSDRVYVVTGRSYGEAGTLVAVDKQNGELTIGYKSNTEFTPDSGEYTWLGDVESMFIYSHDGFGVTEAYDQDHTSLLWQNKEVVLWKVLGILEDRLIGMVWEGSEGTHHFRLILAGLDVASGKEHWRTEIGTDRFYATRVKIIAGRLLFRDSHSKIAFIDPVSGSIDTILSPGPAGDFGWANFTSMNGVIVSYTTEAIAFIAP